MFPAWLFCFKTISLNQTYIFEPSVEDLKLFLGELGLFLQLVHAFGAMTHSGKLKVIFHAVCGKKRPESDLIYQQCTRTNLQGGHDLILMKSSNCNELIIQLKYYISYKATLQKP